MTGRLLRILRIALQLVAGGVIAASAAGAATFLPSFAAWLERVQIFPAVMSFSMVVFVSWLIITLIFGRVYCSTLCPLSALMDAAARIPRLSRKGRQHRRYQYRRPMSRMQYVVLIGVMIAMMAGVSFVASLFDPYTVFVGIVRQTAVPAARAAAEGAAAVGDASGWWSLSAPERILAGSVTGCLVNTVILLVVVLTSATSGRLLCNTICPIGTTLGFVSRYSIMQVDIDTDKCIHCGRCEEVCKASCIDLRDCVVDGARCVDCFDCLTVCPNDAIHYTGRRHQLSDVLMQRIGSQRRSTESTASTAMNVNQASTSDEP